MSTNDKRDSWVSIHIRGGLEQGEISIKDTFLYECVSLGHTRDESMQLTRSRGNFHSPTDQTLALTEQDIDQITIPPYGIGEVCTRGRRGSEGWMDLFHGEDKICELHWDNRDEKRRNSFEVTGMDPDKYRIACSGWSPQAGPMGHVFIDVEAAKAAAKARAAEKIEEEHEELVNPAGTIQN